MPCRTRSGTFRRAATRLATFAALGMIAPATVAAAADVAATSDLPCAGRWDVTLSVGTHRSPAWFELKGGPAGPRLLFQPPAGAPVQAREVAYSDGRLVFSCDPLGTAECRFEGERFTGTAWNGRDSIRVNAVRAPEPREGPVSWGKPVRLFDGRSLDGWSWRWGHSTSWAVRGGALVSSQQSDDLKSVTLYTDFKLHLKYRLHPYQDSGVHLRGRYEIQITDRSDSAGPEGSTGAVYGRVAPLVDAQRPAGRWNTLDVELVGSRLTALLNGKQIHDHVLLAGITGDALDSNEGEPGPFVLQGHCGLVEFRDIVVTPAR